MRVTPIHRRQLLAGRLDELVATFDIATLRPDPLQLLHEYHDPLDQESAGLIAAAFAYGRADIVVANVGGVLRRMKGGPHAYLLHGFERRDALRRFADFRHRFHKVSDLVELLDRISRVLRQHHSLGELFRTCYSEDDRDLEDALTRFVDILLCPERAPARRQAGRLRYTTKRQAATQKRLQYLLSSPRDGSACKRMNLFLRWMVRRTPPDLGIWSFVDPAKLVMPLDTHVHRITTFLGLNRRRTPDWKAARALTDELARFRADDPVRYDFAICRLGILDLCSRKRRKEQCDVCLLNDVCRLRMK